LNIMLSDLIDVGLFSSYVIGRNSNY